MPTTVKAILKRVRRRTERVAARRAECKHQRTEPVGFGAPSVANRQQCVECGYVLPAATGGVSW